MYAIENESLYQDDTEFWNTRRRQLFGKACDFLTASGTLDQRQLDAFLKSLAGNRKVVPRKLETEIRKLLTQTNRRGITDAVLPAIRIPLARPSILPGKPGEFSYLPTIANMEDFFWSDFVKRTDRTDAWMLGFAISMSLDGGYGKPVIAWLLQNLQWQDLRNGGVMRIPFDRKSPDRGVTELALPETARLLLYAQHSYTDADIIFCPELTTQKERSKGIAKRLHRVYMQFRDDFSAAYTQAATPNLDILLRIGRLIPVLHGGLEPFFLSVTSDRHLPTADPSGSLRALKSSPACLSLSISQTTHPQIMEEVEKHQVIDDWGAKARTLIGKFLHKLRLKANIDGKLTGAERTLDVHSLIDEFLAEADTLSQNTTSAVHLALCWARSLFRTSRASNNPTIKTLETYLSRVFTAHLLYCSDAVDLTLWSPEEIEIEIQTWLEATEHQFNTHKCLGIACKQVFRFAEQHGFTQGVDINFMLDGNPGGTSRATLIDLFAFDEFLQTLLPSTVLDWTDPTQRDRVLIAVACAMAFYGGLRAGEITRLTLSDLPHGDGECWIEVVGGKTRAARRRIPLHLLAPRFVCDWVERLWSLRRDEFPVNARLDQIPVFGPRGLRERYTRRALIEPAIRSIKHSFGNQVVFHSLRHSFASWLLIRWYHLRYPDVMTPLASRSHEVFKSIGQERLTEVFTLLPGESMDPSRPSDFVVISKIMGHVGQRTLFRCYIQGFGYLHHHAMLRMDHHFRAQRGIDGETIAALIPKMSSPHTRSKITEKTVHGLLTYLKVERAWNY